MKYKLYHRKSKCWVSEIKHDYGDYDEFSEVRIASIEFIGDDEKEYAKVIDDKALFSVPSAVEEKHGLERIYLSGEAYKYYSEELDSWLVSISDATMFEYANKNNIYPMFNLRRKAKSDALVVREEESIKWLDENTKLKKVKVSE